MTYQEYSEKLSAIKCFAEKCATGTPQELATKLHVSERTARRMINQLRQKGNDIKYCRCKQSYILK